MRSSFADDVVADRRGDVEVVSGEGQVHQALHRDCRARGGGAPEPRVRADRPIKMRLAQVHGRDLQRFPVLGDRAPGDDDALLAQHLGDPAVGQRRLRVLRADQLLDQRADRGAEAAPPVSVATWLPKKYLSSKVPRGVSMYFCVVTREIVDSCRLEHVGDLAQHHRAHRDLAVLEEAALPLDDRLRRRAGSCRSAAARS